MELTNEQFNVFVNLLTHLQRQRTVVIQSGYTFTDDDTITIRTGNEYITVSDDWDMELYTITPDGKITNDDD